MTTQQLTTFAQNYHLNTIKDPHENKFWIVPLGFLLPAFAAMFFSLRLVWITGIVLTAVAFLIVALSKKIGEYEVLNNIGLIFTTAIFYPFVFLVFSSVILKREVQILFIGIGALVIGILAGVIYVVKKIKSFENYDPEEDNSTIGKLFEKRWFVALCCGALAFIMTLIVPNLNRTILGWLMVVLACILCVASTPFLIACTTQMIILKKCRLHILPKETDTDDEEDTE